MAVYTPLNKQDMCSLLSRYNLGEFDAYTAITEGVENTNYFLDIKTSQSIKRYVLTLFEYQDKHTLAFFIAITTKLQRSGLCVPAAIPDKNDQILQTVKGKPAVIVPCLPGQHPQQTTVEHCKQIGEVLASIHKTQTSDSLYQTNHRGLKWMHTQQQRLSCLRPNQEALYMKQQWQDISSQLNKLSLPKGIIHGDLFTNNALFVKGQLTGIIDFYQSCYDILLYDVAVSVNDWCIIDNLELDHKKTTALLTQYAAIRPFTQEEKKAWPLMLRLAAFRFWISRIITFIHPEKPATDTQMTALKQHFLNPDKFKNMLELRSKRIDSYLP